MTRTDAAPLRRRVWLALESQSQSDRSARLISLGLICLIIANVVAVVPNSVVEVRAEYGAALDLFEAVCIGIFTLE